MYPVEAPPQTRSDDMAPLFAAMGDQTRLHLLRRLCTGGPLSITRLSSESRVSRQAITKHLEVLCQAGLIRGTRQGREKIWEIEPSRLDDAHRYLDSISRQWGDILIRLKTFVES